MSLRLCCEENPTCDKAKENIERIKEQGRKEGEKNCKVYCEKCNFEDEATICKWCHLEEIKQKVEEATAILRATIRDREAFIEESEKKIKELREMTRTKKS